MLKDTSLVIMLIFIVNSSQSYGIEKSIPKPGQFFCPSIAQINGSLKDFVDHPDKYGGKNHPLITVGSGFKFVNDRAQIVNGWGYDETYEMIDYDRIKDHFERYGSYAPHFVRAAVVPQGVECSYSNGQDDKNIVEIYVLMSPPGDGPKIISMEKNKDVNGNMNYNKDDHELYYYSSNLSWLPIKPEDVVFKIEK